MLRHSCQMVLLSTCSLSLGCFRKSSARIQFYPGKSKWIFGSCDTILEQRPPFFQGGPKLIQKSAKFSGKSPRWNAYHLLLSRWGIVASANCQLPAAPSPATERSTMFPATPKIAKERQMQGRCPSLRAESLPRMMKTNMKNSMRIRSRKFTGLWKRLTKWGGLSALQRVLAGFSRPMEQSLRLDLYDVFGRSHWFHLVSQVETAFTIIYIIYYYVEFWWILKVWILGIRVSCPAKVERL